MRPATWPWQVKRENGIWDSSSTWTEKPSEPFKKSGRPVEVLAQCRASILHSVSSIGKLCENISCTD